MTPVYRHIDETQVCFTLSTFGVHATDCRTGNELAFARSEHGVKAAELIQRATVAAQQQMAHLRRRRLEAGGRRCRARWLSPAAFASRYPDQAESARTHSAPERWYLFVRVPQHDGFCPWGERVYWGCRGTNESARGFLRVSIWEGWDNEPILVRAWDYDDGYWRQGVSSRYAARELVNRMIALTPLHVETLHTLGFRPE